MKLPKINLEELKKIKEDNFKERLEFVSSYANWVKKKNNKEWSSAQKDIVS